MPKVPVSRAYDAVFGGTAVRVFLCEDDAETLDQTQSLTLVGKRSEATDIRRVEGGFEAHQGRDGVCTASVPSP